MAADLTWKDTTSYSQGSRGQSEPRSWTISTGETLLRLDVTVTRHLDYPGEWLLVCRQLDMRHALKSDELEAAKAEALKDIAWELERHLETVKRMQAATSAHGPAGDERDGK
jgi:predicted YcjX-like family ATPase